MIHQVIWLSPGTLDVTHQKTLQHCSVEELCARAIGKHDVECLHIRSHAERTVGQTCAEGARDPAQDFQLRV